MYSRTCTALLFSCLLLSINPLHAERDWKAGGAYEDLQQKMHTDVELDLKSSLKEMEEKMKEELNEALDRINAVEAQLPPRPVDQHELTYPFNVSFSSFMEGKGGTNQSDPNGLNCEGLERAYEKTAEDILRKFLKLQVLANTFFPTIALGVQLANDVKALWKTQSVAVKCADLLNIMMHARTLKCSWAQLKTMMKEEAGQKLAYVMMKSNPGLLNAESVLSQAVDAAGENQDKQSTAWGTFFSATMNGQIRSMKETDRIDVTKKEVDNDQEESEVQKAMNQVFQEKKKVPSGGDKELDDTTVETVPSSKVYWVPAAWGMECHHDVMEELELLDVRDEYNKPLPVTDRCERTQRNNEKCGHEQYVVNEAEQCWCIKPQKTCSLLDGTMGRSEAWTDTNVLWQKQRWQPWQIRGGLVEVSSNTPRFETLPEEWQKRLEHMNPEGEATDSMPNLAMPSSLAHMQQRSLTGDCDNPLCAILIFLAILGIVLWIILLILTCGFILLAIVIFLIGLIKCAFEWFGKWLLYHLSNVHLREKPTFTWGGCLDPWWLVKEKGQSGNLMRACFCILAIPAMAQGDGLAIGFNTC